MSTPQPPEPYGQPNPYGQPGQQPPPAYGGPSGYAQPPAYGQQPAAPAYGQQPPAYGQQPPSGYAQPPAYGQQAPAPPYGQPPAYGQPPTGEGQLPAWGQEPPRAPVKPAGPVTTRTVVRRTALGVVLLGLAAAFLWIVFLGRVDKGPEVGDCLNAQHKKVSCTASDARWKVDYRKNGTVSLLNCASERPGTTPYDGKYRSRKHTTRYRLCLSPVNAAPAPGATAGKH
ncbi:hypothetical protein ACFY00_06205 [Kitasatospora sp. NPDC001540]|uniref:LppU/SCO3897 family protein n=1 Tax=Kitasatospora sp. NPDC001540 TaxID=3364014 RepID=UPI003681CD07